MLMLTWGLESRWWGRCRNGIPLAIALDGPYPWAGDWHTARFCHKAGDQPCSRNDISAGCMRCLDSQHVFPLEEDIHQR